MKTCKLFLPLIFLVFMFSCTSDDDASNKSLEIKKFVSLNPANPLLLKLERSDNISISYYGDKDVQGRALNCNLISVKTPDSETPVFTTIDNQGRPTKVFASDGSSIKFNYEDINNIRVSVITSSGENRLSFPLNDFQPEGEGAITRSLVRQNKKLRLLNIASLKQQETTNCNNANLKVNLNKCGDPFNNATIMLLAKGVDEPKYQAQYSAVSNGDGNYCFNIVKPEPSELPLSEICSNIESVLSPICTGLEFFNTIPGAQLTLCASISSVFTAASLPVFVGCEVLINSLNLYCLTLGGGIDSNAPSVLSSICESEALEENIPSTFSFKPAIYIDGGAYVIGEDTGVFPTEGPFSDINIELPANPKVNDFYTDPTDPNPEQDYVATAEINCIEAVSNAIITVVGTDGFSDSVTLSLPQGNSTISLSVPGAEGGVKDFLSVTVEGLSPSTNVIYF